jgi:hypothetical protein
MYPEFAFLDLRTALASPGILIPVAGLVLCGVAVALFRGSLNRIWPLSNQNSKSLMNFSSLGTLRCVCGAQHPNALGADRRQFCRSCGCEVIATDAAALDRKLSSRDIKSMTRSLRKAAVRASHLELPPAITTVDELHLYLENSEPKARRARTGQSAGAEQPQVH